MKKGIVKLTRVGDRWIVEVNDQSLAEQKTFLVEDHAKSWARGQAVRLGVSVVLVAEKEDAGR